MRAVAREAIRVAAAAGDDDTRLAIVIGADQHALEAAGGPPFVR